MRDKRKEADIRGKASLTKAEQQTGTEKKKHHGNMRRVWVKKKEKHTRQWPIFNPGINCSS